PERRDGDARRADQRRGDHRFVRRARTEPHPGDRQPVRDPHPGQRPQRSDRAAHPQGDPQPAGSTQPHRRVQPALPVARAAAPGRGHGQVVAPAPAAVGELPVVLLPVGPDDAALDATLAALDAATPAGTRVWLADDASAGPRGIAIIEHWLGTTALCADYTRRQRPIGPVAHLDEALSACGDADVAVLAGDAVPGPGWLQQLSSCLA